MGQGEKTGYVKLSSKFNLTPEAIKYRVKRLENNNIILGNSIVLNGHKFNKLWSIMLLNIKPEYMDELKIFLKTKKYLSNFKETSGIWNFTIKIFANDIKELHEHINEIRENFSEHIREQDFLLLLDFYKFPKVPECVKN